MKNIKVETINQDLYKKAPFKETISYGFHPTSFGQIILAICGNNVCYLNFVLKNQESSIQDLKRFWSKSEIQLNQSVTEKFANIIFNNLQENITVLLKGTDFQIKVWKALLQIPLGELSTYKKIAVAINSNALRAVGTAIGHNPIAYLVPCHRVINTNGEYGNYGGGKERKVQIINYEGAILPL